MLFQLYVLYCLFQQNAGQSYRITLSKHEQLESMLLSTFQKNVDYYRESLKSYLLGHTKAKFDKNVEYSGTIGLGNPIQYFRTYFDTSFPGLWVMSNDCLWSYYTCYARKDKYKKQSSVTYTPDYLCSGNKVQINGNELEISGLCTLDTLWLHDFQEVHDQSFLAVTSFCTDSLLCMLDASLIPDGVFGLGFPSNDIKMSPPIMNVMDRGLISKPLFSMYTNSFSGQGELLIGNENKELYDENSIHFVGVNDDENAWKIKLNSVKIGQKELCAGYCSVLLDSGTALIAVPTDRLKIIYSELPIEIKNPKEVVEVACSQRSSLPDFIIYIENHKYIITGEEYTVKLKDSCVIGFMENQATSDWVFGHIFQKNFYTIFHLGHNVVGIANLTSNR